MKALVRCAIAAAVAAALLGAVYAALLAKPAGTVHEGVIFTNAEPVDVKSVTVKNSEGEYSFYFDEDGYVLDDIPPAIADLDAFIAFMTNCARLSAVQIAPGGSGSAGYGLDEPAAKADIEFFDGTVTKLKIGAVERVSQKYYAAVDGFEGVYVMQAASAEQFLKSKKQIISHYVTPQLAVSSPLSAIRDVTFTGGGLKVPVTVTATADADAGVAETAISFGTATHIVRGAGVYQLDQTYGVEIFGSLFGIRALDIEGYNLTDGEIAEYGFDDPYMTVEYDMVNGVDAEPQHILLKLVKRDESAFYATIGGGTVYTIGREPFMDIEYERLPLRWFLTPMLMDINAVEVEWQGNSYRFNVDNSDPRNPVVTRNGQRLDVELFRSFYRLVTSAANDGTYLGPLELPESGGLLSITYEYSNPAKPADVMRLYPGGTRRANVFVNGAGEFAMKDLFAERVKEACVNLVSGNPVEENW